MGKLLTRLMALIVLGTIARCEDVVEPYSDSVDVVSSATSPFGCGSPTTVGVRFQEIKVNDKVYSRVSVSGMHLQFAENGTFSLPSDSFVVCAKAAASEDMDAFVFNETCTGYRLRTSFLTCPGGGDLVMFVRSDFQAEEATVVPLDEAPYKPLEDQQYGPYRLYMLSKYVETGYTHPYFWVNGEPLILLVTDGAWNNIFLANGENNLIFFANLDVNYCLNDGAYGQPIALSSNFYEYTGPVLYFFEECGKTIDVSPASPYLDTIVYSHRGFGCEYYDPTGLPDECTIIFKSVGSSYYSYGFYLAATEKNFTMTISETSKETGEITTINVRKPFDMTDAEQMTVLNVSMQHQASERASGFVIEFHKSNV